jgi:hypothetical protein
MKAEPDIDFMIFMVSSNIFREKDLDYLGDLSVEGILYILFFFLLLIINSVNGDTMFCVAPIVARRS